MRECLYLRANSAWCPEVTVSSLSPLFLHQSLNADPYSGLATLYSDGNFTETSLIETEVLFSARVRANTRSKEVKYLSVSAFCVKKQNVSRTTDAETEEKIMGCLCGQKKMANKQIHLKHWI